MYPLVIKFVGTRRERERGRERERVSEFASGGRPPVVLTKGRGKVGERR